jgi:hypothetical protein
MRKKRTTSAADQMWRKQREQMLRIFGFLKKLGVCTVSMGGDALHHRVRKL